MPDYTKPPIVPAWGESNTTAADMVTPTTAEIQTGWPLSDVPPARQRWNWMLNWLFKGVRHIMQRGLISYDAAELYAVGARVIGDDGKTYKCIQAGTGQTPSTAPLYWERWGYSAAELSTSGQYVTDTGAVNAFVVALSPVIAAYSNGMVVRFKAANTNTGAATLNAGGGAVPLVTLNGAALAHSDILAGTVVTAMYSSAAPASFIMLAGAHSQRRGSFQNYQHIAASTTFVVPAGVTTIMVDCWGGGGGGGTTGPIAGTSGGGGGAGGYGRGIYAVTPGQSLAVTIGANGGAAVPGGTGGTGNAGGTSSVGELISANGGSGGAAYGAGSYGGPGGAVVGANVSSHPGAHGGSGTYASGATGGTPGGHGGGPSGGGGGSSNGPSSGQNGGRTSGGGGGATYTNIAGNAGDGGQGQVVIYW